MDADSQRQAPTAGRTSYRRRTLERARGAVERRQQAVTRGYDLAPAESLELGSNGDEVLGEELPPASVAESGRRLGRFDDVREQQRREHPAPEAGSRSPSPAHSTWTHGSSPTVYPSCPAGMSKTSFGPNSYSVPSCRVIPSRPDRMIPMWRAMHQSPPTVGPTCVDQRQPGS